MTREHWRIGFEQGLRWPLVSPDEAAAFPYTDAQRETIAKLRNRAIVGTAEQVKLRLDELAQRFALDEIVVVTWTYEAAARRRSYELLAEVMGLKGEGG